MATEIYYFSGTGNSLHIAKELKKRVVESRLIPMLRAMKSVCLESKADSVGFVFPIHCLTIPLCVRDFLKNFTFKSNAYTFAIASRECSVKVFSEINRIIAGKGIKLDAYFCIQMPQTYLPVFDMDSEEEVAHKESEMVKALDTIGSIITKKQKEQKTDPEEIGMYIYYLLRPFIIFLFNKTKYFNLEKNFYADKKCTGCGTCAHICLSGKIALHDKKPIWNSEIQCLFCFACIHYCPAHAIQIKKSKTMFRGRYHHPAISSREIMEQKA